MFSETCIASALLQMSEILQMQERLLREQKKAKTQERVPRSAAITSPGNAKAALVQLEKSATPRIGHRVINHHPADKVAKTLRQRFKKSVQAQCKLDKMELEDETKRVQSGFSVSLRFHCHGRYWMILTFFTSVCLKE